MSDSLYAVLARCQAEIPPIVFDSEARVRDNGKPYRYASLSAVLSAVKPTLNKHGVFLSQLPTQSDGMVHVTTRLHRGAEAIESTLHAPMARLDFHGLGTAISYLRRYALVSMLGLAAEDDDGHVATESAPTPSPAGARNPPHEQPAGDPDEMVFEGNLEDVRSVPTKTGGTKWGASIMGHGWASTFDDTLGKQLQKCVGRRIAARVTKSRDRKFWNIVDFVELTPADGQVVRDEIPF